MDQIIANDLFFEVLIVLMFLEVLISLRIKNFKLLTCMNWKCLVGNTCRGKEFDAITIYQKNSRSSCVLYQDILTLIFFQLTKLAVNF